MADFSLNSYFGSLLVRGKQELIDAKNQKDRFYRGSDYYDIDNILSEVAKEFPALVLLIITIWSDVDDDGYAGYFCDQYKNGQVTVLVDVNTKFQISDFDTDEDVINARNVDLENKLIPILEKWLQDVNDDNDAITAPTTKPTPAAKTPTAKKPAAKVTPVKKPDAKKPVVKKPVVKTSTSKKPVSKATTTRKPTAKLEGLSFCFTGELKTLKRKEAEEKVKALGGSAKSTVAKGLSYLVTNDPKSGSSKNKKAEELGVKIIDEKKFLALIGK